MAELRATYRLQLGPELDFAGAQALVPYLAALGVSHLYLSPVWQARAGSTHGYDVIDPTRVSEALGGEAGLRALADAAHEAGLGLVLDVVPNHMATDDENPYWADEERRHRIFDTDRATGRHRRFFDIDELAGVRQEDDEVFDELHVKLFELVADGVADGLRIDHPDGLADPAGYLERLRAGGVRHVWVEKILETGERLREEWATDGTTGYEFATDAQALFVDPAGEPALTALWAELSGDDRPFEEWAHEAKLEQARTTFEHEVQRLRALADLPELEEALAALPVYRTYVDPRSGVVSDECRAHLSRLPARVRSALDPGGELDVPPEFVIRFQQTTPPVVAKGIEDTAFYRYLRLVAHNEVGGDPGRWSISAAEFHGLVAARSPTGLLVGTTHDTKRSADVRARIGVLSEMAKEWAGAVRSWHEVNAPLRNGGGPTPAEELLIYQTLIGAWPIDAERLRSYLLKALREAKQATSWVAPDEAHEAAVLDFAEALLEHGPFRFGFDGFAARVAEAGERAALGQLLLRLTVPGIPDIYQGDELWFLALVDPDNRRPVDWEALAEALESLRGGALPTRETAKLHLIRRALELRARRPEAFAGAHTPIEAGDDVVAFLRGDDVLVAVTIRDVATGAGGWELPAGAAGHWRDVLSGQEYELPAGGTLGGVLGPDGRALLERVA